jgi:hypothetical protein
MMRGTRAFLIAGALAMSGRFALACATSDDTSNAEPPNGGGDDASVVPAVDAESPSDAGAEDSNAPVDAPRPTCSADGWCYTTLPASDSYDASAITSPTTGLSYGLRGVWVAPDHRAWAVSTYGQVLLWDGTSWAVKAVLPNGLHSVWGNADELWVSGESGLIMRGTITGSEVTFQRATLTTKSTQMFSHIVGTSATDVWAIADGINGGSSNLNRVWRLNLGSNPPSFSPMTVPSTLPGTPSVRIAALWTVQSDFWIAGYETTCIGKPCTVTNNSILMKWAPTDDGGVPWERMPFNRQEDNKILAATTTSDGVHLFGVYGYTSNDAVAIRLSTDESKLDASVDETGDGGLTSEGSYAWTRELIDHDYGQVADIWATNRNDIWAVGNYGLVRHFDGTSWKIVRTSLTNVTPLLEDLYDIDGRIDPSGEQDLWIVGDDVALHRKAKP